MGNTEDTKQVELKRIPRNPNIPIKDEEVDMLLKEAAKQISEKEKQVGVRASETQKNTLNDTKKMPDLKKETTGSKKENVASRKSEKAVSKDKQSHNKKSEDALSKSRKQTVDKISENSVTKEKKKADENKSENSVKKEKKKVEGNKSENSPSKNEKRATGSKPAVDFRVEEDVYVTKKDLAKGDKMSVSEVIGTVFEGIWTGIKLVVLVTLVTAFVGFFLSRDLLIRGRSGEVVSKQNMNVTPVALSNETEQKKKGKKWSQTIPMEKLTLESDDGKILVAQKVVVNKESDKWVVILHGQNGKVDDIYDIGLCYAGEGYNVLMPDLRAHGESEGSFYGMGWLDRLDVINWIDVVLKDNPSAEILIHGIDLGADTALMLSGEPLKNSVKAIVAEGAYSSAWDIIKTEYKARHKKLPVFPILYMVNPVMKVWAGYSLKEADAVKQVKKTDVPILLICGKNDTYVTDAMTEKLNKAIASEHEVWTIATGTHEDCRFAEPDTYYDKVFEFAGKYIK